MDWLVDFLAAALASRVFLALLAAMGLAVGSTIVWPP